MIIQLIQNQNYEGLIKCGENVFFKWKVNVNDKGVEKPKIEKVFGTDNVEYNSPTYPLYLTSQKAGHIVSKDDITLNVSEAKYCPGTDGNGDFTAYIITDENGKILYTAIIESDEVFTWESDATIDLTELGGAADAPFTLYTQPVTGPTVTVRVSEYTPINTNGFSKSIWEFSTDENFVSSHTIESRLNPTTIPVQSIKNGIEKNTVYYMRVKYVSGQNVESPWSDAVRTVTGSTIKLEYDLKNYLMSTTYPSYKSNGFEIFAMPDTHLSIIDNYSVVDRWAAAYSNTSQKNCPTYGMNLDQKDEQGGNEFRGANQCIAGIYLQVRQAAKWVIPAGGVDASGGITKLDPINTAYGLIDFYNTDITSNSAPVTRVTDVNGNPGSGTNARLNLAQDPISGKTILISIDTAGQGYAVGDVIEYQALPTNASNRRLGTLTDTNSLTLDSMWDVLIHGVGGFASRATISDSGAAAHSDPGRQYARPRALTTSDGYGGYRVPNNNGGLSGGAGGKAAYTLYPQPGGKHAVVCCGSLGGAGGAGFGGGNSGNAHSDPSWSGTEGGGGAVFVNTDIVDSGEEVTTVYGDGGIQIYVNDIPKSPIKNQFVSFKIT